MIGGFAIRAANYIRTTMDTDLLVASDPENETKIYAALSALPDHSASELVPGELQKYGVIRVADEIVVDVMKSAGGIAYDEASRDLAVIAIDGVAIPFASPSLLWRMKAVTRREKGAPDVVSEAMVCRAGKRASPSHRLLIPVSSRPSVADSFRD